MACLQGSQCSNGSRPIFDFNSIKSVKTSACRRNSSAIIGGWLGRYGAQALAHRTGAALSLMPIL